MPYVDCSTMLLRWSGQEVEHFFCHRVYHGEVDGQAQC